MSEFERALAKVLVHEGGYVNHPRDPGGETNKGITKRVYDDFRRARSLPLVSVRNISNSEVATIYRERYWNLFNGDEMPAGVSYVVFDGAVNSGVSQSVKWLQRALVPVYKGVVDGLVGPATLAAIDTYGDLRQLIDRICDQRMAFLKALKTWNTFGKGWTRRVEDVRRLGKAWVAGAPAPAMPESATVDTPKALPSDVAIAPPVAPGDAAAYGGGAAATISQAIGQLQAIQNIPSVANVILWLTVAGVAISLAGFAYRFWAARRKAEIKKAVA